ncbi:MAG: hypothetical protein H7308_03965 [Chthonomonadaceae bacterium]|nr:hypothetical protein [Chthonomonadaceae bacterium]
MTLTINLSPSQETSLHQKAQREGITINALIKRTLGEQFPTLHDENAEALSLIETWIAEVPTDPKAQKEAEEDLIAFQKALNQTRREAGSRPLYPGVL